MSTQLAVVVYGNGDLYRELFNAIAAAFNDGSYKYFTDLSIMLAGTWAILRYSAERNLMVLVKWLGIYYFAFYVVFLPKATVDIIDRINPGHAYTVDNVPLGLALVANLTSVVGDNLTQVMEQNFSLPDDLMYGKTGMVMASRLAVASTQFEVTDPNFNQSLQSFVQQCVFYDVLLNKYTWNDLLNATHIWQFVSQYASPARAFVYYQAGRSEVMTCQTGIAHLNQDWDMALQEAAARYGARLFPDANNAKTQLLSYLGDSYRFLAQISDTATAIMQQNMIANALQNGVMHMSASTGSPAALEAYSFVKAQQQKRLTNVTVGDMAAYWLPIMQNVLEAALYGSFVFVFLLLLFPFGLGILKNYVASLMWLQLWAPMYAILNLFMNFYAQSHSLGAIQLDGGQMGLALSNQAGLAQVNADIASLAGYLSLSVPLFAAGVTKGMMSVFTQAAQYIAGVTQSVASSSAGEAITGNISLGNTQFSNHSSFNTSANHFDTNARVFSGMYTYQMEGGSTLSVTPSGSTIMNNQSAISNLGTSINLAHAIREMASQQADTSYSAALSHANAYSESVSTGLRSLYELGNHINTSESSGAGSSVSVSGGMSSALSNLHQLTERFAHDHNISTAEATRYLGAAYISGRAGVSAGISTDGILKGVPLPVKLGASAGLDVGAKGEIDKTHSNESRELYSAAQDFVQNTNFSQSVDTAVRGVQEHSYRTSNEEGQRLVDNVGSSFDRATQARHEMTSNLQQAQSYREAASFAEENAATINSNASQAFMNSMVDQPHASTKEIEGMMVNNPAAAQATAEQFVQEQAQQYLQNFHHAAGSSPESIKEEFGRSNHQVPTDTDVVQKNIKDKAELQSIATDRGLKPGHIVDKQTEREAHSIIANSKLGANTGKKDVYQKGENITGEIKGKLKDDE